MTDKVSVYLQISDYVWDVYVTPGENSLHEFFIRAVKFSDFLISITPGLNTERPPLIGEVSANLADRGCRVFSTSPTAVNFGFIDRSR
jgi:hypothetical protein